MRTSILLTILLFIQCKTNITSKELDYSEDLVLIIDTPNYKNDSLSYNLELEILKELKNYNLVKPTQEIDSLSKKLKNSIRLEQRWYKRRYLGPQDGSCSSYRTGCPVWDVLTIVEMIRNGNQIGRYLFESQTGNEEAKFIIKEFNKALPNKASNPKTICYKYPVLKTTNSEYIYSQIESKYELANISYSTWSEPCSCKQNNCLKGITFRDKDNSVLCLVDPNSKQIVYYKSFSK